MSQRNPGVVLLLQDHHHGLALALRLRQGENALLDKLTIQHRQLKGLTTLAESAR